jgi:hypothetical protein
MTRGIHLKHLTSTDLGLLGLPEGTLPEDQAGSQPTQAPRLAEVDPALARIVTEVREELQVTLGLLRDALAGGHASPAEAEEEP